MSIVDNVIQVTLDRDFKLPIIVGLNHDTFKTRLFELGHEYFDENRTYAVLFDTIPQELIMSEMKDYRDIVEAFPNDRVFGKAYYIGHFKEEDRIPLIEQILTGWGFKIVEVVN